MIDQVDIETLNKTLNSTSIKTESDAIVLHIVSDAIIWELLQPNGRKRCIEALQVRDRLRVCAGQMADAKITIEADLLSHASRARRMVKTKYMTYAVETLFKNEQFVFPEFFPEGEYST